LTQTNDNSAIKLYLKYDKTNKKASLLINGEVKDFSQETWLDYRKSQTSKVNKNIVNQINVQIHAPKDIPISYIQDLYLWVQISGNHRLHLVAREGSDMKYIPLAVMPFQLLEEAAKTYGTTHQLEVQTPLEIINTIHPNTSTLEIPTEETELALVETKKTKQLRDYIPHELLTIQLKGDNDIVYQNKVANPLVLGSMIQNAIAQNYNNNTAEAIPSNYFWVDIQTESTITYQTYIEALVAVQEGFYLYWDELAFNKYEKSYIELSTEEKFYIQQTSPMLITQYDAIQRSYIDKNCQEEKNKSKTWADLK
jgi:hypothetical protein